MNHMTGHPLVPTRSKRCMYTSRCMQTWSSLHRSMCICTHIHPVNVAPTGPQAIAGDAVRTPPLPSCTRTRPHAVAQLKTSYQRTHTRGTRTARARGPRRAACSLALRGVCHLLRDRKRHTARASASSRPPPLPPLPPLPLPQPTPRQRPPQRRSASRFPTGCGAGRGAAGQGDTTDTDRETDRERERYRHSAHGQSAPRPRCHTPTATHVHPLPARRLPRTYSAARRSCLST